MRRLLWAESARVGIPPHLVTVPSNIYAADGGIDALIREADPSDGCVIPRGETGFQIKASDLGPTACKEELHERGALSEPLKPEIKRLMDAGGNYVLVLFTSLTNAKIEKRRNDIKRIWLNRVIPMQKFGYIRLTISLRWRNASGRCGLAQA